ncbi:hypothetical protein QQ045_020792 [Rhodiola kirilowii]
MGLIGSLVDAVLFIFFLAMAVAAPVMDAHICIDSNYIPNCFTYLSNWYVKHYNDSLMADKPHFFVGLVWLELLFQWPLALINIYALLAGQPWFPTTCLIYGVSFSTSLVAILADMLGSGKASDKLLGLYYPFLGLAVLSILRGLVPTATKTTSGSGRRPLPRNKRD